jgi:hypothetical protein
MLSVLLRLMAYPFSIFWSWCCLYFFDWRLTHLESFVPDVFCTSSILDLPLWRSTDNIMTKRYQRGKPSIAEVQKTSWPKDTKGVSHQSKKYRQHHGIFCSWCCLYFFDWRLTPLVSFGHDVFCTSAIDGLPLWYLLVMMWSVLLWLTAYPVQTASLPKDTKGVNRQSQKYRQHHDQKIPKG